MKYSCSWLGLWTLQGSAHALLDRKSKHLHYQGWAPGFWYIDQGYVFSLVLIGCPSLVFCLFIQEREDDITEAHCQQSPKHPPQHRCPAV